MITPPDQVSIPPAKFQPTTTALSCVGVGRRHPSSHPRPYLDSLDSQSCSFSLCADYAPGIVVLAKGTTRAIAAHLRQWRRHDISPTISAVNSALPGRKDVVRRPETCQHHGEILRAPSLTLPTHKKLKILYAETS